MHNVPAGAESHFKVTVVSEQFNGKRLVARHQWINQILAEELAGEDSCAGITYTNAPMNIWQKWAK